MVFGHLTAYFIDKYLGDYIENLDSKQLKIDLWNGDVVLKDLSLKPNALANFNLPVTVAAGHLHKLSLHIPWKHLYIHPTKITIDGVYLLLTPKTDVQYDPERDEQSQYESKMKEVHKIEQFRKEKEEYENSKTISKHKDTFLERLQMHILRNLEFSISNIHIAFEDKTTKPEHPYSFGITLNYIKLFTTNTEWEPVISEEDSPIMYKFGEMSTLSIYWNSNVQTQSDLPQEDIVDILQENVDQNEQRVSDEMAYTPSEQEYVRPVFDAKIDLEQISLNINRNQYSDLLDLLEFQDRLNLKSKYIKYHTMIDNASILKPSLRRWKFAYAAILHEEVRPRLSSYKWENIKTNLDRLREYHEIYFQILNGDASKKQKQHAQELEKNIDVFNLLYLRRIVEIEFKKRKAEHKEQSWWDKLTSFFWSGDSNQENPEFNLDSATAADEKKKLYDAIGYADNNTQSNYPEEYVDIDLSVRLNMLELNVWSNINENDTQFKVIACAAIPDAGLIFKRRPAKPAFLFVVDLSSFQVFGIGENVLQTEMLNDNRPVLAQNRAQLEQKSFLHIEYETNPLNKPSDNRIQVISQSLEIIYDAFTINKLVECFQPDRKRDLQGIKEIAYSTFNDIKYRSHIFFNHYLKNIQSSDIDIDLPSFYFLLPENGVYRRGCPVLCFDFGHFTFKGGPSYTDQEVEIGKTTEDVPSTDDIPQSPYFPLKLRLENIQLLYANQNDDWNNARVQRDSPMHLIKPITIRVDIDKCIYSDNAILPAWKIGAHISTIDGRVSDARIFGINKIIQSIPFPELKEEEEVVTEILVESKTFEVAVPHRDTQKTLEAVENTTPVQKILQEASSAEEEGQTNDQTPEKNIESQDQVIELEATFELPRIDLLIEESVSDGSHDTHPFVRISILLIAARATMKTYDINFDASLADLSIVHEQFITSDNDRLRLIAIERYPDREDAPWINIHGLLTSPVNPLFGSTPYNSLENQVRVHIGKPVLILQLEALSSIVQFKNDLMEKIFREQHHVSTKRSVNKRTAPKQVVKQDPSSSSSSPMPTFQFEANLDGLRAIIGSEHSQILDIQIQDLHAYVLNSIEKTTANLLLTSFYVLDPNPKARFNKIISQLGNEKQLLRFDFSLFNYPKKYEKTLDDVDCDIKLQLTKVNLILLYKHIDLVLNMIDMFQTKSIEQKVPSNQTETSTVSETMEKFQKQARKLRLDVILNAPSIFIPISSYSNEGLFIDLGQLIIQTQAIDDSLMEEQVITMKNLLTSRVKLSKTNEILGDISLLECAELNILIDRLLYPDKAPHQSQILIKAYWDTIQIILAKDDYACIMKILKENFSEKIYHKIPKPAIQDQSEFKQTNQEKVIVTNKKSDQKIIQQIRFDAQIKKIALTLYLGNSNIRDRHTLRNENLIFVDLRLEMLKGHFRQLSDSSYSGKVQIQELLLDDRRETDCVTRLIDRGFQVDPKVPMFIVNLESKPKNEQGSMEVRQVDAQLESFYICMSPDYLLALQDFFISSLSSTDERRPHPPMIYSEPESDINYNLPLPAKSIGTYHRSFSTPERISTTTPVPSSETESDIETLVDVVIKTSKIILLEDQHNTNSNCLVLDITSQIRMVIVDDNTKISASLKDLTIYGSNFAELKNSKIKYRFLQPVDIDAILIMNIEQQKIDVRIGDITVQIPPAILHTIHNTVVQTEADKINSKTLFDPKPFKDSNFWFIENNDEKQEVMEQTDILEVATGTPSQKKPAIEEAQKQKEKEEQMQTQNIRSQELIVNLNIIEVKLELGTGSVTKPVIAMCLSDMFVDVKNWSSNMSISSKIHVELALFNDNLLAWEPLIEPVINENGDVVCPWCITCSTSNYEDEEEENDEESRFLLDDPKSSSDSDQQQQKEEKKSLDAKQVIYIRADHLLNLTVTKTMLGLAQRLSTMFEEAYNRDLFLNEDDNDKSMLSIHNMTGCDIDINDITGVQFLEDNQLKMPLRLKYYDSIPLTIPSDRLSATRIPAISEQIVNRRQEFFVKIGDEVKTVDINQTWRRVFDFGPSSIPNWPVQLLCDSQLHNFRRRIVLSSIIKVFNRATMPIMILDIDSVEMGRVREVARIDAGEELYLPLNLLYVRTCPRLFISIDDADLTDQGRDFISFDWSIESSADRVLKMNNGKEAHFVFYKESKEAYSENTDEPIRTSFHIYVKLALHIINLLSLDVQCWIDTVEQVDLKPSHLYHSVSGGKKSVLKFVGHIRLFSMGQDETLSEWSEGFSLDVIKTTGVASCKVANDRTYMVAIDIVTTSFGMTKILTLAPSTVIINKSTIEVEVTEAQSTRGEEQWRSIKPEGIIPFWPRDIEQGLMRVRYTHNRISSVVFRFNDKHRALLHMDDEERPALQVDVVATDYDGFRIVFGDYKTGDSPVLMVNCLKNRPIAFCQVEDIRTQILPPRHYVYYTWINPLKPQQLLVSSNSASATIELSPLCGRLETNDQQIVYYATFQDGPQMVLIFSDDIQLIEIVTSMPTLGEKMNQHIQIGICDIGIAVIDDIARNDLFYISINKSKEIWTETRKYLVKPLSSRLNHHLNEHYKSYIKHFNDDSNNQEIIKKQYRIDDNRNVSFDEDTAELSDHQDHRIYVHRQALDGLWIGFAWSTSNQALHVRINRIQIDNEHEFTLFPVVLHPIVSKASGTDAPGKPFIELSLFKTAQTRANIQHIKYLKLLIQEFDFCADQTLIMSILNFIKQEKAPGAPTINMDSDLKRINKPLEAITIAQSNSLPSEPKIFFDNLHLSPLKIHVSFSMHGFATNEQLLAEYPLVDFLLQTLNVAEVQDVILKLNCYERKGEQFTIAKLAEEAQNHFQNQFMRQLHVVVLGLDVLGNPFGVGAMEGPIEFIEGIASGTRHLVGSAIGGAAGAVSKITGVASKGLATLTFDQDYQNARIARKEVTGHSVSDVVLSGKNVGKDVVHGVKGVVKKPVTGAKKRGTTGFVKGLGKGFLGLVARPASGVADFTSTSFDVIKRVAVNEGVVHRVRSPRHVGRDGIIRPSSAHEIRGFYIFDRLNDEKHGPLDTYIAHIDCTEDWSTILLASFNEFSRRLLVLTRKSDSSNDYEVEWDCHYKDLKGPPVVKFKPSEIQIHLKEPKLLGLIKKDRPHETSVLYRNAGEAR
ncbi:unnamed protein product, partial [Rotaria sordida]